MYKSNKFYFILTITALFCLLLIPNAQAADLTDVSLSVDPIYTGVLATWKINFTVPQDTKLGHILISLGGHQPDLSSAELFVSGIPQGNPKVGKSNPNCVFNCDDIRYYYTNPISVKKGTKITFTLNKVKNSAKTGESGLSFINLFSSKYPQVTIAFASGPKYIQLAESLEPSDENLIPATVTGEGTDVVSDLAKVQLNELFFQPGAKTTRFDQIKDPLAVTDLTLDLIGRERVTFKGALDLSTPEAVKYFQNLGDYLTFEFLSLEVKQDLLDYFKVPLDVVYYDLPYVWDPDLQVNEADVFTKDKIDNYKYLLYDNKPQVAMTLKSGGKYRLIPHLDINIQDNQKFQNETPQITFSGRISDPKARLRIDLNGVEQKDLDVKIDQAKGDFTFKLSLIPGSNLIQVEAKSDYGQIAKISRVVEYNSGLNPVETEKSPVISPFNIAAIILALVAIIFAWAIKRLAKKRR